MISDTNSHNSIILHIYECMLMAPEIQHFAILLLIIKLIKLISVMCGKVQ